MPEPIIAYAPRPDATPEAETYALANIYRFVLDCRAKKAAAPDRRTDDARERINDARTYPHCT